MSIKIYCMVYAILLRCNGFRAFEEPSINRVWKLTNDYGGGMFEGEIKIPVTTAIRSWEVSIFFSKTVRNLKVFEATLLRESNNQTEFTFGNTEWNGYLETNEEIYFRIQGSVDGSLPAMNITYQNITFTKIRDRERPPPISEKKLRRILSTEVDYEKAIRLSLKFFEAQKSGVISTSNAFTWKNSSGLYDGAQEGVNLVGGYYDGGGYLKFNYPMAFAVTEMVWGALEFAEGYESAGGMESLFKTVKWATDYFMKCHTEKYEYYGMVGDPDIEDKLWENSQMMNWSRPAYKISTDKPGSDLAAETAAALAAASILFKSTAPKYSETLLRHAKELWEFAERYRGRYDKSSITKAAEWYKSTEYNDELAWGAVWIYKATGDKFYLDSAQTFYGRLTHDIRKGFSYDNKLLGLQLLLSEITNDYLTYMEPVKKFCDNPGGDNSYVLPNGLLYADEMYGPVGFAANTAFICSIVARRSVEEKSVFKRYRRFVKTQIHVILGTSVQSGFMVGFRKNNPKNIHHRDSSCPVPPKPCGWEFYKNTDLPNTKELTGALVGGPNALGNYDDRRDNEKLNQPNFLFNAAVQSALAALILFGEEDVDSGDGSGSFVQEEFIPFVNLSHLFVDDSSGKHLNACSSNPCLNNGKCISEDKGTFSCECHDHYIGELCNEKRDPEFEWMVTWPDGGQIHIHLPMALRKGKIQLSLYFPLGCNLTHVRVWHACFVSAYTNISQKMITVQQVDYDTTVDFIGMTYQASNSKVNQNCVNTNEYAYEVYEPENLFDQCMTEVDINPPQKAQPTTTPSPQVKVLRVMPLDELRTNKKTGGIVGNVFPTVLTEKRLGVAEDLGLSAGEPGLFTWMSNWGIGGQGQINLEKEKRGLSGSWVLRLLFPSGCHLSSALFWHACTVDSMTEPQNGLFTFRQVSWQIYQSFIGLSITFYEHDGSQNCFDPTNYYVSFEQSSNGAGLLPGICKESFPVIEAPPQTANKSDIIVVENKIDTTTTIATTTITTTVSTTTRRNRTPRNRTPRRPAALRSVWLDGPKPPLNEENVTRLRATEVSPSSVRISWRKLKNNLKKVTVDYTIADDDDNRNRTKTLTVLKSAGNKPVSKWPSKSKEVSARRTAMLISGLIPGRTYRFTARSWDGSAYGPLKTVTATLSPSKIEEIRAMNPNATALRFTWRKPKGYQKMYTITYSPREPKARPKSPFTVRGSATQILVAGLPENKEYTFSFRVSNGKVMGAAKNVKVKTGRRLCGRQGCPKLSKCVQMNGAAKCVCNYGYDATEYRRVGNARRIVCNDVDECVDKRICGANAKCVNSAGSYKCECKTGYEGDGRRCYDVDECLFSGVDVCPNARCKNTVGSYRCECAEGFIYQGTSCKDIDECATGNQRCPENAKCINTNGSFSCQCPNGTRFIENSCQDIDECTENLHNCGKSQICINSRGGHTCVCPKGKRKTRWRGCIDINECRERRHNCNKYATCKNLRIGFSCSCKAGFRGNGVFCKDINECTQNNDCDETGGECFNSVGSYSCSCMRGYSGNGKQCFSLL